MTDPRERRLAEALHDSLPTHSWPYPTRQVCPGGEGHREQAANLLAAAPDLFASPPSVDPGLREAAQAFVSHMDGPEPRHGLWATLKADREAIRAALSHPDEDTQDPAR